MSDDTYVPDERFFQDPKGEVIEEGVMKMRTLMSGIGIALVHTVERLHQERNVDASAFEIFAALLNYNANLGIKIMHAQKFEDFNIARHHLKRLIHILIDELDKAIPSEAQLASVEGLEKQ